jgi:uncharacterized membrane protein YdbT with pleckstrin-like domain
MINKDNKEVNMEFSPCVKCLYFIQTVTFLVIGALIVVVNMFLQGLPMLCATVFLFALLVLGSSIYTPLYFKNLKYTLTDYKIQKTSGVFRRKNEIMQLNKIQHTTVFHIPFSFNCVILIASGSKIVIPFLNEKDLDFFCDFQIGKI